MSNFLHKRFVGYLASAAGVATVALILFPFYPQVRILTAANSLLTVVLVVSLAWGMGPGLVASVLGALYLNFFFVPPLLKFDFHIDGTEDLIGLGAFLVTSVTVGQLSSGAHRRAREIERLYRELWAAFDRASQLEAVKRSEQLKSALLDAVTHDLRTPLTLIKAAAATLISVRNGSAESSVPAPISEESLLTIIVQQSNRLKRFIEGMIEWAEIEAAGEKSQASTETMPMDEILIAALARAEDVLRNHRIEVESDDNLSAMGNSKAIAQILFSLLENAGKYAPPATTVRITARQEDFNDILIAVEDEGPGIPPALREKVFDKFFRGDITKQQDVQLTGLGLGLAIARRIVEVHGGKIWIEGRTDGKSGARFVFTLPARFIIEPAMTERVAAE